MTTELVTWNVFGTRPLMQGNPLASLDVPKTGSKARKKMPAEAAGFEAARKLLYRTEEGLFYHPAQAFWKAIVVACPNVQIGGKATSGIVPRAIEPAEEECILYDPDTLTEKNPRPLSEKEWVVDTRRVGGNMKVTGSPLVSRPKWRAWGVRLGLEIDRDFIPAQYKEVLTDLFNIAGGMGVGVGRLRKDGSNWYGIRMGKFRAELWNM